MHATPSLTSRPLTLFLLTMSLAPFLFASCATVGGSEGKKPLAIAPPVWHTGDQWIHAWSSGTQKGIKTAQMQGFHEMRGVRYRVLRVEKLDIYFTPDLHWAWAASATESRVMVRALPPLPWFNWPLDVGRRWEYNGILEDSQRKEPLRDVYKVMGMEDVTVPAGTFRAVKIVREVEASVMDQYWYAPDVGWYVKWMGRRGKDEFQEVLQVYMPAAQSGAPPSGAQ